MRKREIKVQVSPSSKTSLRFREYFGDIDLPGHGTASMCRSSTVFSVEAEGISLEFDVTELLQFAACCLVDDLNSNKRPSTEAE